MEENQSEQMNFLDDKYRFKLDNFEGPLDLLLHLIKSSKMDIMEVHLADITEQYLEYMVDIPNIDMDKASEFITIAATLIEIKSKQLLPVEQEAMEADPESEEQLLLRRIKEYELFKQVGQELKTIEDPNKFYRAPGEETEKVKIIVKDMVLDKLLDAFAGLLAKASVKVQENPEPKKIIKDRFTVAEKVVSIRQYSRMHKRFVFEDLFVDDMTKSEMINVFLALLELLKMQTLKIEQSGQFNQISIISKDVEGEWKQ